jgi:epoxyqueuosine reductase
VAKYAWGTDYHHVLKPKLKTLLASLQAEVGAIEGRVFVDSAPVLERTWAAKSGLGWVGKNGNLLTKQVGSFYFLAELIIDLKLTPDGPTTDHCGRCTACVEACPTEAIVAPTVIDSRKCISYLTIELKEALPPEWRGKTDGWVFGCDVCQDVCPWNRFSKPHSEPAFGPNPELLDMSKQDWLEMTAEVFGKVFKGSAVKRAGFEKLKTHYLE